MPSSQEQNERARSVQAMFARVARRYDLMNRLMTAGQDVRWRREVICRAQLSPEARLLDLGAGTGDLAAEALRQQPGAQPVAADFTIEMMQTGRRRMPASRVAWSAADALNLPFSEAVFSAVVSGFLVRNVVDIDRSLAEQRRVLARGGWVVILDTTRPRRSLFYPLVMLQLRVVIPFLGKAISGEADAYRYLPETTENFLAAEELARRMVAAGFRNVGFRRRMFGAAAIHWGQK